MIYLKENHIGSYADLTQKIQLALDSRNGLKDQIREAQRRMQEISAQRKAILVYRQTRDVYTKYKESGWSPAFYRENKEAIEAHKQAQAVYSAAEGKLPEESVGELLSAPGMTQERVLKTCVPCEKHPYISFLGYKAGENVFTYAEYSKEKAVDMLVLLRHIADYVIVDCTSVLTGNVLATAALEVADDVLRVCGCDLKAISYFASYLPLIEDRKFKPEQHIRVLSNTRPYPGGMEYENSFGGVKYRLPYLPIVEEQAATLKLLEPLAGKEAKSYEPVIAAIAAEVFGDGK